MHSVHTIVLESCVEVANVVSACHLAAHVAYHALLLGMYSLQQFL